ncbi:MAG: sigma 54-interacting transcriptional regulator [Deltaproteobacteria bacterium]|nr:sigma 54-interacting transcriptional regulator [Deltaproteobacteria bacterium]
MQSTLIYGHSKNFLVLLEAADEYAKSHWPILILGETGTGKELLAQRIHEKSGRRGAFVAINCGAIPSGLFESELFGYERGAFSGAVQNFRGLLRAAQGGTLFLDEVGELELQAQVKLLRLFEKGEVRSLGSSRTELADVRFIAATNCDLHDAAAAGYFRVDLLARLAVLAIRIPPLRERKDDIIAISKHWLHALKCDFDEANLCLLQNHPWPGNIRQLKNVLVRASLLGKGRITHQLLESILSDELSAFEAFSCSASGTLADIEKHAIVDTLKRYQGNRKKTAEALGIAKSTLHEKLRRWKKHSHPVDWPADCRVIGHKSNSGSRPDTVVV